MCTRACVCVFVCVLCVHVCVYVRACVHAYVHACVCLCMCMCMLYVCTNFDCIIIMYTYVAVMQNLQSPTEDTAEPMETGQIVFN